jgi:hypothetical protein
MQLVEPNPLIHPVETRGGDSQFEDFVFHQGGLQRDLLYFEGSLRERGTQVGSETGIRFYCNDRSPGLEQPPGHQTGSGADLEHTAAPGKPTPPREDFVDSFGILRTTGLVHAGVASKEMASLVALEDLRWLR